MKYRPEIDGLRSVAVIPVILFHAGFGGVSGGFVGVDVFFVISGYLIAKIIISEMQDSRFSYTGFYERRVRRILPALAIVVLVSISASLVFGLPEQVVQASKSGLFALVGVSNIFFWTQSGYFAPASEYQLLLHTWSLGVEEQFYLLLPPFLYLIFRLRLDLRRVLAISLPLLFLVGLWLSISKPSVAFYLLPARAWELALGGVLAARAIPQLNSPRANEMISLVGLLMIVASVFLVDSQMFFPGWVALLPCMGTFAVIYSASSHNIVGRLLSMPPLRFIGLISYSLYLWHWPVFVSLRMHTAEPHFDFTVAVFGIALSTILATLTWKFIEIPFRSKSRMSFRRVAISVGSVGVVSIVLSVFAISNSGLPNRLTERSQRFISAADDIDPLRARCQGMHSMSDRNCLFGTQGSEVDFVVIGDSHAGAIRPAIEQWALSSGRAGTILWRGGCPMLLGATKVPDADGAECAEFKGKVVRAISENPNIDTVIVAGRWETAYSGIAPEVGGSFRVFWVDDENPDRTEEVTNMVFERALVRTGRTFEKMGAQVIFLGAIPEVGFDVPRILALASHNRNMDETKRVKRDTDIALELDQVFERVTTKSGNFSYISVWEHFCDPDCSLLLDGVPLYSDDDHLTLTAAREFMGPILARDINKLARVHK